MDPEQQSSWSQGSLCYNTWSSAFCKVKLQHDWQLVQSWAQSTQWVKTIFPPISTWWKYEIFPHFPFLFVLWCWRACFWWADPATECCCYKSCCTHMFRGTRFTNKFDAFQKCIVQQQTLWMVPKVIVHRIIAKSYVLSFATCEKTDSEVVITFSLKCCIVKKCAVLMDEVT